jgi:hypothetical protein
MTPSKPSQDPEIRLTHDVRATRDMASLRFSQLGGAGQDWGVLRLVPEEESGSTTIPGAYIQGGRVVAPEGAQSADIKSGTWSVLAFPGKTPHPDGRYSWQDPLQRSRVITPEDLYSPFINGGIVLCKPPSAGKSMQEFNPVFLLFPDWVSFVTPAAVYVEANGPVLEARTKPTPLAVDHLRMLLQQSNGILLTLAFRRLSESQVLTPDRVSQALASPIRESAAVVIFLLLMARGPASEPLVKHAYHLTEGTGDPAKLREMALGGYTAMTFGDTAQQDRAEEILKTARRQFDLLGVNVHVDAYLKTLFDFANML